MENSIIVVVGHQIPTHAEDRRISRVAVELRDDCKWLPLTKQIEGLVEKKRPTAV